MSSLTEAILREIHNRIKFSSWRCNLTTEYLNSFLPDLQEKFLMTGCPVMYDRNILEGSTFSDRVESVIVTVTERGDFWEREIATIDFVVKKYKSARKTLSLHQDFDLLRAKEKDKNWFAFMQSFFKLSEQETSEVMQLREYARHQGFKIFKPKRVEECYKLYNKSDLHIGSRVHAHLYFLSQAKKTFVTYVDDRCLGFSKTLDFPICDPQNFEQYLDYNFEIYRHKCIDSFQNMYKFVSYIKNEIL
jgi:hypothetical protein